MPRNGLGMPISASQSQAAPVVIDDVLWEDFGGSGGEIAVNYQETRTNIVLHSQDTTDAEAWTKENTAIDSTLYEAPDNSTTANAIKSDGTGEQVYNIKQDGLSVTAGKTYTLSAHVKKENLGFAQLRFSDGDGLPKAHFNLTTGAITHASNTIRTQIDAMDNDWYRCSITFVATTSTGSGMVFAQSAAGDGTPNVAVSGIVLIYVWGFQLEENIEASPYIVTTTEARTATTSLNDTSDVWDFDSANLMPEADPDSEGVWEIPDNIVLNGGYEELGSELVTNGDFASDTWWGKSSANINISNGKGNYTAGTTEYFYKANTLTIGKQYKIVFEVTDYTAGYISAFGGNWSSPADEAGTYEIYFKCVDTSFGLVGNSFVGSIDNVTLKQVDPNDRWVLGTGWSIEDGKATSDGTESVSYLRQNGIVDLTSVYEIKFTVSNSSSGTLNLLKGNASTQVNVTSNNTYTFYTAWDGSSGDIVFQSLNFVGSVDNVTVKEYAIQPQDV